MRIENTVLFGKYQISRVIGTGRTGCVFLAVHLGLNEYRAVKRVSKACLDYQQFRQEGLILKELRHPGIPIVYDLEEDESYCYLIEEYLEGNSLYDLVQDLGHLSEAAVILYGIQICRIVNYLHSAGTFPILHLDLQPKNLLLCQDASKEGQTIIKLVDFGHAATVMDANLTRQRYGTIGCAAPEQYTDAPLDVRTDIYAIGVLLHYMSTGTYPDSRSTHTTAGVSRQLKRVMRTCLQEDRDSRYQSVSDVLAALERTHSGCADVFTKKQLSSLTIALVGSKSGTGTTHLAIGLSMYLEKLGIPNMYEEKNKSGMVNRLGRYAGISPDSHGLIRFRQCTMKPGYGPCVKLKETGGRLRLADYGTDLEALCRQKECSIVLLVCGGMWWETEEIKRALDHLKEYMEPIVILPCSVREYPYRFPEEMRGLPCYLMPYFPNPFHITHRTESFYDAVFKEILDGKRPRRSCIGVCRRVRRALWSACLKRARNICRMIGGR